MLVLSTKNGTGLVADSQRTINHRILVIYDLIQDFQQIKGVLKRKPPVRYLWLDDPRNKDSVIILSAQRHSDQRTAQRTRATDVIYRHNQYRL